jgi:hypothetical protein
MNATEHKVTEEQAERGLAHLRQRREDGEYIGVMWSNEAERRLAAGEELPAILEQGLDTAARWLYQASQSYHPTRPTHKTMAGLFEATGQDPARYGYRLPINSLDG